MLKVRGLWVFFQSQCMHEEIQYCYMMLMNDTTTSILLPDIAYCMPSVQALTLMTDTEKLL